MTNLGWAAATYFAVKPLSIWFRCFGLDPIAPIYFTCQAAVSTVSAAYKLWYAKKQQN